MVTHRILFALALGSLAPTATAGVELLDFYLPTCGPCRMMEPTVARLEQSGVAVRRVDGSREPALAGQLRVESYPTFVAVRDGQEVARVVGATSYEELRGLVARAEAAAPAQIARGPAQPRRSVGGPPGTFAATAARDPGAVLGGPATAAAPEALDSAAASLLAASVRLTINDEGGRAFGTGTIVDAREGEALVVTCAHLFRGRDGQAIDPTGRLTVELYAPTPGGPRVTQQATGVLVSHDFDADVALVAIQVNGQVATAAVAPSPGALRVGDAVRSVGCDLGADPTVRDSRVVDLNRYNGPPNIEASGAPVQGRSGGGLFDARGRMVGVCFAADEEADEGLYAGLASIHAQLDRIGLSELYRGSQPAADPFGSAATASLASQPARSTPPAAAPEPIGRTPDAGALA
ncbi:MAG: trypsin-like peptidase domain-containing protein, partial [Planctomycetota bacterium]